VAPAFAPAPFLLISHVGDEAVVFGARDMIVDAEAVCVAIAFVDDPAHHGFEGDDDPSAGLNFLVGRAENRFVRALVADLRESFQRDAGSEGTETKKPETFRFRASFFWLFSAGNRQSVAKFHAFTSIAQTNYAIWIFAFERVDAQACDLFNLR
jgi:hypothetical protein